MNKIVAYSAGAIFVLGMVIRILTAVLFPDRFARGARRVLFLDARERALFPAREKKADSLQDSGDHRDNKPKQTVTPLPGCDQKKDGELTGS